MRRNDTDSILFTATCLSRACLGKPSFVSQLLRLTIGTLSLRLPDPCTAGGQQQPDPFGCPPGGSDDPDAHPQIVARMFREDARNGSAACAHLIVANAQVQNSLLFTFLSIPW
eukprot:COSAG06_NODE_909_length_11599_cov_61.006087_9_plen_113_part_00